MTLTRGNAASTSPARLPAPGHRVGGVRVAHRPEREQPRHRRQAQVDRGWRQRVGPAAVEPDHVRAAGPASHSLDAARSQEPQQHVRRHRRQVQVLVIEPAAERQQPEPVGADRAGRVVPVSQMRQIVVHQPEPADVITGELPTGSPACGYRNAKGAARTAAAWRSTRSFRSSPPGLIRFPSTCSSSRYSLPASAIATFQCPSMVTTTGLELPTRASPISRKTRRKSL
jgi:hypothetical protein